MSRFINKTRYASDEEWSRILLFNFICCSVLGVFNLTQYFKLFEEYEFLNDQIKPVYPLATDCLILFQVNIWVGFVNMVMITCVCGIQIIKIILDFHMFFVAADVDKLIARSPDLNVVVYI